MRKKGLVGDLWRARSVKILVIYVVVLIVLVITVGIVFRTSNNQDQAAIPKTIINMADFPVYFYKSDISAGFTAEKGSASLTSKVLFVRMKNEQSHTITVTQQALPPDLSKGALQATEEVSGASGDASITVRQGQLTGNLLTADRKTLVIINTTDAVSTDTMKTLLRELKLVR